MAGLVSAPVVPAWTNDPVVPPPLRINSTEVFLSSLCLVPQSPIYQLYATIVAFYLPLFVILVLNAKVYFIARGIIDRVRITILNLH